MLHKPEGYVTTVKDQFQRPTVMDLLNISERVYPVGRLDYDTSGLLLLTNDGDLTYHLTHPKHNIEKTYEAKLFGIPSEADIARFQRGIVIDGKKHSQQNWKSYKKIKNMQQFILSFMREEIGRSEKCVMPFNIPY